MPGSTRGTLYPGLLPEFYRLAPRADAGELVRWFWITRWSLPDGEVSRQVVISFPALNLVVENGLVGLAGPTTHADHTDLSGSGWAIGALLRPAAVPVFTTEPGGLRDGYQPFEAPDLYAGVEAAMAADTAEGRSAAAERFAAWLVARAGEPTEEALLANRLADLAEDPGIRRVGDLAETLAVSERTLQRLARSYIGLSPAALIRRRRLQEAAERIRDEPEADLAALANDLGYTDQAHLTNEFARVLGFTPASYRRAVTH
ncbi:MAG TPA: helix-turn-helix domain-containing protein [Propionicimonas sp.]|uniref:helix-turn-helix domain-containing protein n=1 Tax=Propionicimonas sp. TaxID=1955623 RepID=UPI002F3FA6F1